METWILVWGKNHTSQLSWPQGGKKICSTTLREIFDQFHFNLSCQSINNRKKEKCFFFAKYAVGGEITKKGWVFLLFNKWWELKSYLLFCGVKNLQLLPSTRLWQHSSRFRVVVGHRVIAPALLLLRIDRIFGQNYIFATSYNIYTCVFYSR